MGEPQIPYPYDGMPDTTKPTCSRPAKNVNRGCQMHDICKELSKGKNPINVFFDDKVTLLKNAMPCFKWYESRCDREERFVRTERPKVWLRTRPELKDPTRPPSPGNPVKRVVYELEPPEEEYRNDEVQVGGYKLTHGRPNLLDPDAAHGMRFEREEDMAVPGLVSSTSSREVTGPPTTLRAPASPSRAKRAQDDDFSGV